MMPLRINKMTEKYAIDVLCWKYERPYDFYNNVLTSNAILELIGSNYYVVLDNHYELIGYFCIGLPAQVPIGDQFHAYEEECMDIGIGMKPELTGKGNGSRFFSAILEFIQETHQGIDLRLTVAAFNKRAIRLYENMGFVKQMHFKNKEDTEFIVMKRVPVTPRIL